MEITTRKEFGEYYLGLDIGTDSVGWAVTDPQYNILKFNGKSMWGVHLFKEGKTAKDRRQHRIARRRLQRRKERLSLLAELLDAEISSIDPGFFARLDESNLWEEDKRSKQPNSVFNDPCFKDKDYHKKYPTIYHLRNDLMTTNSKPDIRLVYLALHHAIKYRGHFLYEGLSDESVPDFIEVYEQFRSSLENELSICWDIDESIEDFKNVLMDRSIGENKKKQILSKIFQPQNDKEKTIINFLAGSKQSIEDVFEIECDKNDKSKFSFKDSDADEKIAKAENDIGTDKTYVIAVMKQLFDWGVLSGLLGGHKYISEAMVDSFDQHHKDLHLLKDLLKAHAMETNNDLALYNKILKSGEQNNYCAYSGNSLKPKQKRCTQADFCKFLRNELKSVNTDRNDATRDMMERIDNGTFMPKQKSTNNSVIPNALHRTEVKRILENISQFYPFLNDEDEFGTTIADKIVMLCSFRRPYFVGTTKGEHSWAVMKGNGRIFPWNFENRIDIDATQNAFIKNLVSRCSYLTGEKVLPKQSILYSRFMLYNEINNIRVNGLSLDRIRPGLKSELVREYFENNRNKKVTTKDIKSFIISRTGVKDVEITGMDDYIKANLNAENALKKILNGNESNRPLMERIIFDITAFGEDRTRLKSRLKGYGDILTADQIDQLARLKLSDWGKLSEKFLTGIYHRFTDGREMNILTALEQTDLNLMELLSEKYSYISQIRNLNGDVVGAGRSKIEDSDVDDLYCSPAVKHSIRRVLAVVNDILKITGHCPTKVFIETTRESRDDGRKASRKESLKKLYENCTEPAAETAELLRSLDSMDEPRLRGKKLYAYYLQEGKCAYCGKNIDLNDIGNKDVCDMDHIRPQSKVTDDSIHNNLVLVHHTCNQDKSDKYPIDSEIQTEMYSTWGRWHKNGLMNDEKFRRLTRKEELSEDELAGFINRQLVETSQSVKAVAHILEMRFGTESDIVYVKGTNVNKFKQDNIKRKDGIIRNQYLKCREVNDLHHAKDAYLNIVVGNVYDVKFTKNPIKFLKTGEKYNLNKMFENNVSRGKQIAWVGGENGTIRTVDKYMLRNNILYTRAPYKNTGELYDLQPKPKSEGQHPIKKGMDVDKYGGYNKVSSAYYIVLEHTLKGIRVRTLETVTSTMTHLKNSKELEEFF